MEYYLNLGWTYLILFFRFRCPFPLDPISGLVDRQAVLWSSARYLSRSHSSWIYRCFAEYPCGTYPNRSVTLGRGFAIERCWARSWDFLRWGLGRYLA